MDSVDKNEEKWVGIEEAANHLGVNKDTIRNWIKKKNGIPAHKIGKLWTDTGAIRHDESENGPIRQ